MISRETQTSERRVSRRGGGSRHGTLTLFLYKVSCSRCLHEKSRNLACRAWPPPGHRLTLRVSLPRFLSAVTQPRGGIYARPRLTHNWPSSRKGGRF